MEWLHATNRKRRMNELYQVNEEPCTSRRRLEICVLGGRLNPAPRRQKVVKAIAHSLELSTAR